MKKGQRAYLAEKALEKAAAADAVRKEYDKALGAAQKDPNDAVKKLAALRLARQLAKADKSFKIPDFLIR